MSVEFTLTTPQKITIVESIIEQIVRQIREGILRSGDRLPSERQLIEMLGVSRSSVREALQGLAAMGLVEIRPGDGTFVKELRPRFSLAADSGAFSHELQKEMRQQLNQARLVLEDGIIQLACQNRNAESQAKITQALDEYLHHPLLDMENFDWSIHDRMHVAIAEATGNPFLVQILQRLLDMVPKLLRDKGMFEDAESSHYQPDYDEKIHVEMCQAIIQGDVAAARQWLQEHFEHEELVIQSYFGNHSFP